jgi:acyl transferase domain-containing protein/thioesterase domain-containing protein/acyl carrier protein
LRPSLSDPFAISCRAMADNPDLNAEGGQAIVTDIAVVGLAGRFPGARTPAEFWSNLAGGVESIRSLSESELRAEGIDAATLRDPSYVKAAATLEGVEDFDAGFFGFSPREASVMDPQHRHFLEVCWEALESAGHVPENFSGRIGVFGGSGMNAYMPYNLFTNTALMRDMGLFLVRHTGNDKDFLTTRVAYCLDLRGPAVNVQTACSTSLVAIHTAVQSLLAGECDLAIAGGVTIELPHAQGYHYEEGEILSPDGHCRAFDHRSQGTVFGSGAGVVVLRRLSDALEARDTVHAVVKSTSINNDGGRKVGYLAPSVDGQADCIAEAIQLAGLTANDISYVECHGTGTPVGDPIEVAALTQAFRQTTDERGFCKIGSVKTNIGHLDTAAGVASFIKVVEMMRHGTIAPTLHYQEANPSIDFPSTPFSVASKQEPWRTNGAPRRAGVSSLGVGGTNAHIIVEEAPAVPGRQKSTAQQLLVVSARTADGLEQSSKRLADHLEAHPDLDLGDVAHTLLHGRRRFAHRKVLSAQSTADAIQLLRSRDPMQVFTNVDDAKERPVIFMLPGGGAQHPNMFREVYEQEAVFREELDSILAYLLTHEGVDVRSALFPQTGDEERAAELLEGPALGLPALAAVEIALAKLLESFGIRPVALIGHSLGENVASYLAGVMDRDSLLKLVCLRGRLFEQVEEGAMLAISLPESALVARTNAAGVDIATINADESVVVSGARPRIEEFASALASDGTEHTRLRIRTAAHSSMLEPILPAFRELLESLQLSAPNIDCISNVSGDWISQDDATNPQYWVKHLRSTVRFRDGLETALKRYPDAVVLEVGPGHALTSFARQHRARRPHQVAIPVARHHADKTTDAVALQRALGRLWASSVAVNWDAVTRTAEPRRVPLPTYPFQRERHWIEPGQEFFRHRTQPTDLVKEPDQSRWFYMPGFEARDAERRIDPQGEVWLLLTSVGDSTTALADATAALASSRGVIVKRVRVHDGDVVSDNSQRAIRAGVKDDVESLLQETLAQHGRIDRLIDLCGVGPASARVSSRAHFDTLLTTCAVLASEELPGAVRLLVTTDGLLSLNGERIRDAQRAMALGIIRVAPKECQEITASLFDLPAAETQTPAPLADAIVREACVDEPDAIVAWRGGVRHVEQFTRLSTKVADEAPPFPTDGATLITGGLGGIGLTIAHGLADAGVRALVMTSRHPLPPRERWLETIAASEPDDPQRVRLVSVLDLEAKGVQVHVSAADVTSRDDMQRVWREATATFGSIRAVVHAAGTIDDAPLALKHVAAAHAVVAPKVEGAQVLLELIKESPVALLVFFSSSSAVLGPAGQVDYVAANAALDALAVEASQQSPTTRVVSLAWGVWRDVGMAASMFNTKLRRPVGTDTRHPLLGIRETVASGARFSTLVSAESTWVLDEHRLRDTRLAVLPGTAYVELARAAAAAETIASNGAIEIRDLFFTAPLAVTDGSQRLLSVSCTPEASGTARVQLSSVGENGGPSTTHAEGSVQRVPASESSIDLEAVRARCNRRIVSFAGTAQSLPQDRHLLFGAGWQCLQELRFGSDEAIALLKAPTLRAGDEGIQLPPGVLDMASGFAFSLLDDGNNGSADSDELIVPLGYERVIVHGAIPEDCVAHVVKRHVEKGAVAAFDVSICATNGRVVVAITGYLVSRVKASNLARAATTDRAPQAATSVAARAIEHGITPAEGFQAFKRAIGAANTPRVLVSSIDFFRLQSESRPTARTKTTEVVAPRPTGDAQTSDAPRDEVERTVCELWSSLLGVKEVGIHDNFFDLGGHSLVAVRLFARIKKRYGVELSLALLFEAPTVAQTAEILREELGLVLPTAPAARTNDSETAGTPAAAAAATIAAPAPAPKAASRQFSPLVRITKGDGGPAFFCVHGAGGNVLIFHELGKQLGDKVPLYGLQARGVDGLQPPQDTLTEMADLYLPAILEAQPNGPYLLGGFSGGGVIAIELARRLRALGHEVRRVVLLDSYCPIVREKMPPAEERLTRLMREGVVGIAKRVAGRIERPLTTLSVKIKLRYFSRKGNALPYDLRNEHLTRSFHEAAARYVPVVYDGPVTLLKASDVAEVFQHAGPRLGWDDYLPDLEIQPILSGHHNMLLEPGIRMVGAVLRDLFTEIRRT